MYPPETTFRVTMQNGSRVRIAPADTEYTKVKLTSARLQEASEGRTPGLPRDVVALAMHKHRKSTLT